MSAYSIYILGLSPDGYWRLDEASGTTAADSSGHTRTGTYTSLGGSITYSEPGAILGDSDTSVAFAASGLSGYDVDVPADATINTGGSFTWLGWVKIASAGRPANRLETIAKTSGATVTQGWWVFWDTNNNLEFYVRGIGGDPFIVSAHTRTLDAWHMVAVVYDASAATMSLYVDAVLDASQSVAGMGAYTPGAHDLLMGDDVSSNPLAGHLDEASYWARALSASEILGAWTTAGYPTPAFTATIGGSVVNTIAGTLNAQQQIGQRGTGSVSVWSALGVHWAYGTRILIQDAFGNTLYNGYVSKDHAYRGTGARQGVGYLEHDLTLMDNAYRADKRLLTESFLNEQAGNIVNDIVTNVLAAEGVSISGSVGSGSVASGVLITEKAWVLAKCSEALDWLAEQCGYWWTIDASGVLWFQPYNGLTASESIDGTTVTADDNLSVDFGNELYVNRQFVKGGYDKTPQRTEYFKGDGVRRAFTLAYEVSDMVSVTRDGATQTTGTKGVDSGRNWYFAVGDAVIAEDDGGAVMGSGDTLAATYKGRFPVIGLATNPSLIAAQAALEAGGTGYVESVVDASQVYDQATATQQAAALLAKYGSDMVQLNYYTRSTTLVPGQSVSVTLSDFGLTNKTMLVTAWECTDGVDGINLWYHITAVGSPYSAAQWQLFYKRLMAQTPDSAAFGNIETVVVVAGALQANSVLSVTAQVVAPSGADVLQANAILQGP